MLPEWMACPEDLVDFETVPMMSSKEGVAEMG